MCVPVPPDWYSGLKASLGMVADFEGVEGPTTDVVPCENSSPIGLNKKVISCRIGCNSCLKPIFEGLKVLQNWLGQKLACIRSPLKGDLEGAV